MITWIVLGIIVLLLGWVWLSYNHLARLSINVKDALSDIDVQLKRRYDLIPNLVETVKGYATHEREAFENVTNARARAMNAGGVEERGKAEDMLSGALKSLFAVAEAYPDLKANQNFLELQRELSDTENKIQAARRFYNSNVRALNTAIATFPGNVIAGQFRYEPKEFFALGEGDDAARNPVKVSF